MATTVTITPSAGFAPAFTESGQGSGVGYGFLDVRRFGSYGAGQEGVIDSGGYLVTQRGAGANMSVDVASSTGSGAYVQGDAINPQGLYYVPPHSAVGNLTVAAADSTNPRVDSVVLEVKDTTLDASGSNLAQLRLITGTATSGATLDNRTNAPALPSSALLLADILVGAGVSSISNSSIRDRRPFARGAYYRYLRTASDYTTTATSATAMDSTNLNARIECTGVPLKVSLRAGYTYASVAGVVTTLAFYLDGAAAESSGPAFRQDEPANSGTYRQPVVATWDLVPAAGSHLVSVYWWVGSGTATMAGGTNAGQNLQFTVEEVVRQNARNNATTSG